jgi:hypothetical protein
MALDFPPRNFMYSPHTLPPLAVLSLSVVCWALGPGIIALVMLAAGCCGVWPGGVFVGAPISSVLRLPKCDTCILGKQTRTSVPKKCKEGKRHRVTRKLEGVWVDLSGPHTVRSCTRNEYVMDIADDYTSFPSLYHLKRGQHISGTQSLGAGMGI